MHRSITRMFVAVAAGAALAATGASAPGAAARLPEAARLPARMASGPAAGPGAQLWVKRFTSPGRGFDAARSVAASPNRKTVYVTGGSDGATSRRDYATAAYNAATGALLWLKRYNGPGNNWDFAFSMAVSPAGKRVFITGESAGATTHRDYATIAYRG